VEAIEIVRGLDRPVHAAVATGEPGRIYVVEQAGAIRVVEDGVLLPDPFLDIRSLVRTSAKGEASSEEGLLSLAFAPDYERSGRFSVAYTDRRGRLVVAEYPGGRAILTVAKDEPRHMGGALAFGPDGRLYASVGDDSLAYEHAQRLDERDSRGKIVRLDANGKWSVVVYGLRNPWRFAFDRAGDIWVADVGEASWEEVNVARPSGDTPPNLGWPAYEGYEPGPGELSGSNDPVWPVAVYAHQDGCAVVGGFVYGGDLVPALHHRYVYGDFCTGRIWSLDPGRPADVRVELDLGTTVASFAEDADGELLVVSRTGTIFRLAAR
jgi:glucose/arabinose dehydrogenase